VNPIVLVRRTIDNRQGKLLTNLVGPWMNGEGRGDSVKRGGGRISGQQTQTNRWKDSVYPVIRLQCKAVLPNLFSTAAHFLGTAHQTAHCIFGTYFIYKTYILCIIHVC